LGVGVFDLIELESAVARSEVSDAVRVALTSCGRPGSLLTSAERVAIYRQSRVARTCPLCSQRKAALSPYAVDGGHDGADGLSAAEVDAVHRISTDSGRLSAKWHGEVGAAGVDEARLVELIAVVTTTMSIDTLHRGLGLEPPPVPDPVEGAPSGIVAEEAVVHSAWVPTVEPERAEGLVAEIYARGDGAPMPMVPNITRALTLVPAAAVDFLGLLSTLYILSTDDVPGGWGITRPQMELVAASVSAHNDCFY
jgi:hypothetical protein